MQTSFKRSPLALFFVGLIWLSGTGCGSNTRTTAPINPVSPTCAGTLITGAMQDSLTFKPVAQGWAVLESGSQLDASVIYNFAPTQQVATDAQGSFSLCTPTLAQPAELVLEALDASGNAYPAYIAQITGAASLGAVQMGGCSLLCDVVDGQVQTAAPTTITGTVTTMPVAVVGTLYAQFDIAAPDGSKNVWSLAIPSLDTAQKTSFTTTAGSCANGAPYCTTYSLALPSIAPLIRTSSGTTELAASPVYDIYAAPAGAAGCKQPFGLAEFQQDGKSFLVASAGAQLTAQTIAFTACQ